MEFRRAFLADTLMEVAGPVVVIDVLRAFSTAAYAFAAGAQDIAVVGTVAEAFALRGQMPRALIMGEVDGLPVEGFDFDNSPAQFLERDFSGKHLIQRTSSGTQGVVLSRNASPLLTSSFVVAGATARFLQQMKPHIVTFVITGYGPEGPGDEDAACADYLESLLNGEDPEVRPYLQRVRHSPPGQKFLDPDQPEFKQVDLDLCLQIDRFDFVMQVERIDNKLTMRAVP
jgi:2-phosphosulfolactate phosphatase